jgi:hypothetical protein
MALWSPERTARLDVGTRAQGRDPALFQRRIQAAPLDLDGQALCLAALDELVAMPALPTDDPGP